MPETRLVPPRSVKPTQTVSEPQQIEEKEFTGKGTVQLNYYGAPWETVLRNVADGTNSRLIANRVPGGRYTRRDNKEYTRQEAVRIINIEIEPKGFRLIEQDEMLVVMDIPAVRPRYQPAEIKSPLQRMAEQQPAGQAAVLQPPAGYQSPAAPKASNPPRQDSAVRPVKHEESTAPHPLTTEPEAAPVPQPPADDPVTVVVFRARHRRVMEISKQIYRAYPQRTELLSASADGLPAFRIRLDGDSTRPVPMFDITIDSANEEVRIEARKSQSKSLIRLFRALDVPKEENQRVLYSKSPSVCRIAAQMVPQMEQLRRQRAVEAQRSERRRDSLRPVNLEEEFADDREELEDEAPLDPPAPAANDDRTELPDGQVRQLVPPVFADIVGNLKGEVRIESFEDLGALVIIGAAEDVERVMEVIKQLEKLSELTAPQVHLEHLEHVDSRALAGLLTTVFERLTKFPGKATQPRESVAILSVTKPNAILIIAPAADLPSIRELAHELDQPVDPQTEFQVFQLKTAVASQVAELLTEFYENQAQGQQDEKDLSTRIQIRADARTNSVIVRARPRDLDEAAALIKKIDRETTASVSQLQIFTLKYAAAAEIATILNQAIQSVIAPPTTTGGGGNLLGGQGGGGTGLGSIGQVPEELRGVKSSVIEFLAVDSEGERLLRSGMLTDIKITPDARQNALVVSAPERSMKLMAELINQLDRPAAAVQEIKVFPLVNADATKVVQQLQQLFSPQGQQGAGGFNNQARQMLGIQVLGADDAASGLIPMRFSVDTRTNSVIAIGGAEALGVVEAILLRLDESDIRERKQIVYRLKNSPAVAIAQAVTQFLQSQREVSRLDPNLISSVEQLEREVIVVAEPVSNSLLISATPRYFEEIQKLVKKLDEAPAQVMIQALLVEVTLDNTDEFGIEMGFQDSVLFDRSVLDPPQVLTTTVTAPNGTQTTSQTIISQTGQPGFNFNNPALPLGNNLSQNPGKVGTQGLSNFSLGRINGDLGFGGLVLSAGSESVNVLLRALSASRRLQVLSRPQIRTLDNQTATVQQGQMVPIVQNVTVAATGLATPNVTQDAAGIILTVTPRISPDGQIVMDIMAEKSAYNLDGVPIFTDANTGNVVTSPIKDLATARAVVSVPNNQTVVIGGLINSTDDRSSRKVPWLGDIPVLGYLFRYDSVRTNRRELLIFLTPRLVREDAESEMIKDVEMARMHFIECEAEEIHGPLRGVPAEFPVLDQEPAWIQPDGTLLPVPPEGLPPALPPGQVVPPPAAPPAAPKAEPPVVPPKPPEPGLLNDELDDELFDVPAPPPEARRKLRPTGGKVQHANHQSIRSQTPGEVRILRPTAPKQPSVPPQQPGVWKSSSRKSGV